jgi:two-component system, sensor histidine kinase and response regulator
MMDLLTHLYREISTMPHILIIEDEPQVRANLREILNLNDFQTLTAPNGQEGLLAAQDTLPDLILCDVSMPQLDGYGVLQGLRQNPQTNHIPMIFLTANSDRPEVRHGMELGAADYLTKPCSPNALLKAINTQLTKRAQLETYANTKLDHLRTSLNLALPQELDAPLTQMINTADRLLYQPTSPEGQAEQLKSIRDTGLRLHRTIHNYLLFADLEMLAIDERVHSPSRHVKTPCSQPIIRTAQRLAQSYQRDEHLVLDLEDAVLAISELKLVKIMEELLDNAFKFSSQTVYVMGRLVEGAYKIDIIDNGQGFTQRQIAAIGGYMQFDRTQNQQTGVGLGLAIARHLTQLNGGHFHICSELGCETIITITLPTCSP